MEKTMKKLSKKVFKKMDDVMNAVNTSPVKEEKESCNTDELLEKFKVILENSEQVKNLLLY